VWKICYFWRNCVLLFSQLLFHVIELNCFKSLGKVVLFVIVWFKKMTQRGGKWVVGEKLA
jgi:hypothetical protein